MSSASSWAGRRPSAKVVMLSHTICDMLSVTLSCGLVVTLSVVALVVGRLKLLALLQSL